MKAILIALALAVGIFATPSTAQSEKEIVPPMIVTASAAPVAPIIVMKSIDLTPVAKKKTHAVAKKKISKPHHHKSKASGHHKSKPQTKCTITVHDGGLVKLHNLGNHDYGHIGPSTFHLTAQPPCA